METQCSHQDVTIKEFCDWLDGTANESSPLSGVDREENSCYIDYKYMKDVFEEHPDKFDEVRWKDFGLVGFNGYDSTIWLSSEGANTPGHQDTYGFNLITQIYGRKLWILFPPEDSSYLYPTRVPYEESSIFTEVNIRKPDLQSHPQFKLSHPYVVTLQPGQTLYVPRHWWHYVESLEPSISVNVWVPLREDRDSRFSEAITRCLATSLISSLDTSYSGCLQSEWLNPTETLGPATMNLLLLKASLCQLLENSNDGGYVLNTDEKQDVNEGSMYKKELTQHRDLSHGLIHGGNSQELRQRDLSCGVIQQGYHCSQAVMQDDLSPGLVPQDDLLPGLVQQDDLSPVLVQSDDLLPVLVQQDVLSPVLVQQDDFSPGLGQPDDLLPVLVQQDDLSPELVQQDDLLPVLVQQDDLSPVLVQSGDLSPELGQPDDLLPVLVQQDDLSPGLGQPDDLSPGLGQPDDLLPVLVQQDDLSPELVQQDDLLPVLVQQDDLLPLLVQQDDLLPVLVQQDDLSPELVQQDDLLPVLVQQDDLSPGLVQKDDLLPKLVQPDDLLPVLVQQDDLLPVLVQQDDLMPGLVQQDDLMPGLVQQDDLMPGLVQQDDFMPGLVQQDDLMPGLVQQDDLLPVLVQKDDLLPKLVQPDDLLPGLVRQDDLQYRLIHLKGCQKDPESQPLDDSEPQSQRNECDNDIRTGQNVHKDAYTNTGSVLTSIGPAGRSESVSDESMLSLFIEEMKAYRISRADSPFQCEFKVSLPLKKQFGLQGSSPKKAKISPASTEALSNLKGDLPTQSSHPRILFLLSPCSFDTYLKFLNNLCRQNECSRCCTDSRRENNITSSSAYRNSFPTHIKATSSNVFQHKSSGTYTETFETANVSNNSFLKDVHSAVSDSRKRKSSFDFKDEECSGSSGDSSGMEDNCEGDKVTVSVGSGSLVTGDCNQLKVAETLLSCTLHPCVVKLISQLFRDKCQRSMNDSL